MEFAWPSMLWEIRVRAPSSFIISTDEKGVQNSMDSKEVNSHDLKAESRVCAK